MSVRRHSRQRRTGIIRLETPCPPRSRDTDGDFKPIGAASSAVAQSSSAVQSSLLGANDGLLSTASLVMGVDAAHGGRSNVLSPDSGAISMAAGEYVSVYSQKDTEDADLSLKRRDLRTNDQGEHEELAAIYVDRGLGGRFSERAESRPIGEHRTKTTQ